MTDLDEFVKLTKKEQSNIMFKLITSNDFHLLYVYNKLEMMITNTSFDVLNIRNSNGELLMYWLVKKTYYKLCMLVVSKFENKEIVFSNLNNEGLNVLDVLNIDYRSF